MEESKIDDIIQRYHLDNIYYGLDNKNIFKRVDRFNNKRTLVIIFSILALENLHEIIFSLWHFLDKRDPDNPDRDSRKVFYYWNIVSEFCCDIYVGTLLTLSWLTFTKLKIGTKIFF